MGQLLKMNFPVKCEKICNEILGAKETMPYIETSPEDKVQVLT